MPPETVIQTPQAPKPIGCYTQARVAGDCVFISGQIALDPTSGVLDNQTIEAEAHRVFANLSAIVRASGGSMHDIVKLNLYLTNMADFAAINECMIAYFFPPYPARAAVGVMALPKGARFEAEAVLYLKTQKTERTRNDEHNDEHHESHKNPR
jgi:reactive intermediate/imine deaminase